MVFNTFSFLLFGAIFFSIWPRARHDNRTRWATLTAFSFVFYGWWDWRYLALLLLTGLVDFYAALGMERWPKHKKTLFILSIGSNLLSLAIFKYLGFLTTNANAVLETAGAGWRVPVLHLILPVGISFYTFQSMSYTIDVYRGLLRPTHELLHFLSFLSIFPHLVAGPIMRAVNLLPQLEQGKPPTQDQRWDGLRLLVHGYFKKMVIADQLAPVVNHAFQQREIVQSWPYWWIVVTMFAVQIYCDFAGYSDIALGLGKWMGYEFPKNFDHPYVATSFKEFWMRWQISLSSWFRDYVYIPLGGARDGAAKGIRNMWITMLLFGLWHGAAWTFIVCGAALAAFMTIERATDYPGKLLAMRGGRPVATLVLLAQIWVAWVLFRSASLSQAGGILAAMFNPLNADFTPIAGLFKPALAVLAIAIAIELGVYVGVPRWRLLETPPALAAEPIFLAALMALCIFFRGPGSVFIYFQF